MLDAHAAEHIAEAYLEYASGRVTICFVPTIAAAEAVTEQLQKRGVAAEYVTGKTPAGERRKLYDALEAGEIRVLTSVQVLTTGFDSPEWTVCSWPARRSLRASMSRPSAAGSASIPTRTTA